jgi:CheY-like chemotaxis protein
MLMFCQDDKMIKTMHDSHCYPQGQPEIFVPAGKGNDGEIKPGSFEPQRDTRNLREKTDDCRIRVLFVDDHEIMRQGLVNLVSNQAGILVVGEASDGEQAVEKTLQLVPDVVVMDISMPRMDGLEATRRIKARLPQVKVIGLSMFDDAYIVEKMTMAGADAFITKSASAAELLKVIHDMAESSNDAPGSS